MNNQAEKLRSFLESQQVEFRLLPHQSPTVSIEETAKQRNVCPSQMVKSMVLRDMSNRYALACTAGDTQIDPKKVRAILNWRRMTCVATEQLYDITGYAVGTITPLLLKNPMPIIFDESLSTCSEVTISSGSPMAGIAININDLEYLTKPIWAKIKKADQ